MKRLELGDDYHSSDTEESKPADEESDDYDSYGDESALHDGVDPSAGGQLSPDLQSASKINDDAKSQFRPEDSRIAPLSETHTIAVDQMTVVDDMFNPLRFLALHLKELNEQDKLQKNQKQ